MARKTGWDPTLMHAQMWHGAQGAIHRDGGYGCHVCGTTWRPYERRAWWPIFLRWSWFGRWWRLAWHGWEIDADGPSQRVFGQTFHLGPLKVCFGRSRRDPSGASACAICHPPVDNGARLVG